MRCFFIIMSRFAIANICNYQPTEYMYNNKICFDVEVIDSFKCVCFDLTFILHHVYCLFIHSNSNSVRRAGGGYG